MLQYPQTLSSNSYWIQYALIPHPSVGGSPQNICLPLPGEISESIEASYDTEENQFAKDKSIAADFGLGDGDTSTPWYKKAWRGITNTAKQNLTPERYKNVVMKGSGQAVNTHEEHYFKGMEFKTFEFTHRCYPRNQNEVDSILDIISTFKNSSMPTLKPGNSRFFGYPDSVTIHFHGTKGLPDIQECIIEKVETNYTPNDSFQPLPDGSPVGYEIVVGFKEKAMPTRGS
tara:strand:- start:5943 stop:6632 length:690 start_codon:yes stop_codon:yes gene_type:complete